MSYRNSNTVRNFDADQLPNTDFSSRENIRVMTTQSGSSRSKVGLVWQFMSVRKKFWLLPLIVSLFALGALMVATQGSALAPFIYTLF